MRLFLLLACCVPGFAVIFGTIRGVVHDPDHRPVPDVRAVIKSKSSDFTQTVMTRADGTFEIAVPVGEYEVRVEREGFDKPVQGIVVASSGGAAVLHFQLALGKV